MGAVLPHLLLCLTPSPVRASLGVLSRNPRRFAAYTPPSGALTLSASGCRLVLHGCGQSRHPLRGHHARPRSSSTASPTRARQHCPERLSRYAPSPHGALLPPRLPTLDHAERLSIGARPRCGHFAARRHKRQGLSRSLCLGALSSCEDGQHHPPAPTSFSVKLS